MCGITGYIGPKNGFYMTEQSLRALEYRGYDSAGIAYFDLDADLRIMKEKGSVENLTQGDLPDVFPYSATIGHTRWATHGEPSCINAHPHSDCSGTLAVVHNGIIENYRQLRKELEKKSHHFKSETDTEVFAHLIEEALKKEENFLSAFRLALKKIQGAYAFAVVSKSDKGKIYIARFGSPLVVGIGNRGEYFLASDQAALVGNATRVMHLKDGQSGFLKYGVHDIGPARPRIEALSASVEEARCQPFSTFMQKEIHQIPEVIEASLLGRLGSNSQTVKLGGLDMMRECIVKLRRLDIVGCGTSFFAGFVGKLLIEELTEIPVSVSCASEFRYSRSPLFPNTGYIFISQSGETADTLAALKRVSVHKKLVTLGIVNVVGSAIARGTQAGVYNRAGAEIGVASTKAFLSQLTILTLMSLYLAKNKRSRLVTNITEELRYIPDKIRRILRQDKAIAELAKKYAHFDHFMYLGRGVHVPTAFEGALKIKEIAYVHAEGYPSGELKHGPIALIDETFPTVAVALKNRLYPKLVSNLEEVKARKGPILAIATRGDRDIRHLADDVIYIPPTIEQLEPMLAIVPLQLFALHVATLRGHNVDRPRNLAKSVTVE